MIFVLVWLIFGLIAWVVLYNSTRKWWYDEHKKLLNIDALLTDVPLSKGYPYFIILCGMISFIVVLTVPIIPNKVLWWKCPKEIKDGK